MLHIHRRLRCFTCGEYNHMLYSRKIHKRLELGSSYFSEQNLLLHGWVDIGNRENLSNIVGTDICMCKITLVCSHGPSFNHHSEGFPG